MNVIVKNIPNAITCLNILSGSLAVVFALHGEGSMAGISFYHWACIFIGIAAVADFLDGFAARMLHAYSNLGKELDSLCDAVSFGVAPAMLLFSTMEIYGAQSWLRWPALLIPVFGVLRLARFNIDTRQSVSFIGLPIPANAIFWIGYTALAAEGTEFLTQWYVLLPVLIAECYSMVSGLRLFSLKFKTWGWKGNEFRWLLIVMAVALVAFMGLPGLMWLIVAYILYGLFARD